jgi:predicted metal-dependent phosphoesterase TrpH
VDEVIAIAHSLGALAVLAHPGRSKGIYAVPASADDIAALSALGLDGIEVYYPSHSAETRAFLLEQAQLHGLLVSGGNDSHHPSQELASIDRYLVTILDRMAA